jgi:hypothetical protein
MTPTGVSNENLALAARRFSEYAARSISRALSARTDWEASKIVNKGQQAIIARWTAGIVRNNQGIKSRDQEKGEH